MEENTIQEFSPREHISPFQINLFNSCATRYYEMYREQIQLSGLSKHTGTELGNVVHNIIHYFNIEAIKLNKDDAKVYLLFKIDEILEKYRSELSKHPRLCSKYFIDRGESHLRFWFSQEEKREARIVMVGEFPGSEVPFEIFLPNGILIKGFIDRVEKNKYCLENEYALYDWKTGYLSDDYSDNMLLYKLAMKMILPKASCKTFILQLENQYFEPYSFNDDDLKRFYNYVEVMRNAINNFAESIQEILKEGNKDTIELFLNKSASVNKFCYTCSRRIKCIPYIHTILNGIPGNDSQDLDIDLLVSYMEQLDIIEKLSKKESDRVEMVLLDYLKRNNLEESVLSDGRKIIQFISERRYVDTKEAVPILIDLKMTDKLKVDVKSIDEAISKIEDSEIKDKLKQCINVSFGDPKPKIRGKIKK